MFSVDASATDIRCSLFAIQVLHSKTALHSRIEFTWSDFSCIICTPVSSEACHYGWLNCQSMNKYVTIDRLTQLVQIILKFKLNNFSKLVFSSSPSPFGKAFDL